MKETIYFIKLKFLFLYRYIIELGFIRIISVFIVFILISPLWLNINTYFYTEFIFIYFILIFDNSFKSKERNQLYIVKPKIIKFLVINNFLYLIPFLTITLIRGQFIIGFILSIFAYSIPHLQIKLKIENLFKRVNNFNNAAYEWNLFWSHWSFLVITINLLTSIVLCITQFYIGFYIVLIFNLSLISILYSYGEPYIHYQFYNLDAKSFISKKIIILSFNFLLIILPNLIGWITIIILRSESIYFLLLSIILSLNFLFNTINIKYYFRFNNNIMKFSQGVNLGLLVSSFISPIIVVMYILGSFYLFKKSNISLKLTLENDNC